MKLYTVKELIAHFGGQEALAEKLDITQPAISAWVKSGEIPLKRAFQIERMTNKKIKACQLPMCEI